MRLSIGMQDMHAQLDADVNARATELACLVERVKFLPDALRVQVKERDEVYALVR